MKDQTKSTVSSRVFEADLSPAALNTEFRRLAEQETRATYAIGSYAPQPRFGEAESERYSYSRLVTNTGHWRLHGTSESFEQDFYSASAKAGRMLGCSEKSDPKDYWLHRLYFHLWENRSKEHIRCFDRRRRGRAIIRPSMASAMFISALELAALKKSPPTKHRRIGRPRADKERERVLEEKKNGKPWKQIMAELNEEFSQNKSLEAYRSLLRSRPRKDGQN